MHTILIIDDQLPFCEVVQEVLSVCECHIDIARDYITAREKIISRRYNLIILDINLLEQKNNSKPDRLGIKLLSVLEQNQGAVPCIIVTGDFDPHVKAWISRRNVRDIFLKHEFAVDRFLDTVQHILENTTVTPDENTKILVDRIIILFISASPTSEEHLKFDSEMKAINEKLSLSPLNSKIEFVTELAARDTDISGFVLKHNPHVIHFSGHGTSDGHLLFEGYDREIARVPISALKDLFSLVKSLHCLVLNACWTSSHARSLSKEINCVIGTSCEVSDDAAICFSRGFYSALGHGRSFNEAFQFGITEMKISNFTESSKFKVKFKSDELKEMSFVFKS